MPVCSAASRSRCVSARTIARWYDAARSARRSASSPLAEVAHGVEQRRLDAGEREVEPRHARDREAERLGIALAGQRVDLGAARDTARPSSRAPLSNASPAASSSVVPSRSNEPRSRTASSSVCPPLASRQTKGGSTGAGAEVERRDVTLEVVDRDERDAARPGDRLGRREADEQRTDQARPARDADPRRRRRARRPPRREPRARPGR